MLSDEEKKAIEQEFQYALDNIVSKIKGETATAIVYSEQSMILLFKRLMIKIEKQSKEIEELKMQLEVEKIDNKYNQEETHEETIPRYKLKEVLEKYKYTEIGNSEKIIEFYKELQSLLEKE